MGGDGFSHLHQQSLHCFRVLDAALNTIAAKVGACEAAHVGTIDCRVRQAEVHPTMLSDPNALKIHDHHVAISHRVRPESKIGQHLIIHVWDPRAGIAAKFDERPFGQLTLNEVVLRIG
eukprot:6867509-Prymnesium_polylepis.1